MKGLIKKDFLLLKSNLTYFIIIMVVFTLFSITRNAFNISFILSFLVTMMFVSTFNYDDFNNWNAYAITLPVERKNIVKSKYISAIIILMLAIILGSAISFLTAIISKNTVDIQSILIETFGAILSLALILAVWLPFIYKFGVEKGRIILFVSVFSISIIGVILSKIIDFTDTINMIYSLENIWFVVVPIVAIIALMVSYLISKKIYLKKEF